MPSPDLSADRQEQKKKLLKAKIAAALYHENGKVPSPEEIDTWTKFAQVLSTVV